jgi:cholesterol transport system auxiliary component
MIARRALLLMTGAGAALGGCGGLLPKVNEPVPLYTLTAVTEFGQSLPKVDWQLVVGTPVASADLDTTRIALTREPGVVEYFAKGAWADNAPVLLQTKLIESFEASDSVAVGRDAAGLRPDYVLQTELRDFQAEYGGAETPVAHLRLSAKLVRMPDRRIIATVTIDRRLPAAGSSLSQIVDAFDRAAGEAFQEVVVKVLTAQS